jgi:hypothetical protein
VVAIRKGYKVNIYSKWLAVVQGLVDSQAVNAGRATHEHGMVIVIVLLDPGVVALHELSGCRMGWFP